MQKNIKRFLIFGTVALVIFAFYYFDVGHQVSLEGLRNRSMEFQENVRSNYWHSVFVYLIAYIIAIAIGLPAVAPMSIIGGFLFGLFTGAFYALIGGTLGSIASYWLVRTLLYETLKHRYDDRLAAFNKKVHEYGASYLLMLHFMSVVPFFIINSFAALANIPLRTVMWTSFVGFIPLSLIYAFAGQQICHIHSVHDIFSPQIILALVLLIALAYVPIIIKRIQKNK